MTRRYFTEVLYAGSQSTVRRQYLQPRYGAAGRVSLPSVRRILYTDAEAWRNVLSHLVSPVAYLNRVFIDTTVKKIGAQIEKKK